MLIDLAAGWAGPQAGVLPPLAVFTRVAQVVVLLVVTLLLVYWRTFSLSQWKSTATSTACIAWLLSKVDSMLAKSDDSALDVLLIPEKKENLDAAAARRRSRAAFLQQQPDFVKSYGLFPDHDRRTALKITETYEVNSRDVEIFIKSWIPEQGQPKGVVFLCHGYGDTITFFFEGVARTLAAANYAVFGMDYPGFGLSEGLHGYIPDFDRLVDDVVERYLAVKQRPELEGLPCFLLGESMGGAVALKAHLKNSSAWDGAVLVAPMCKIADAMYPHWSVVQFLTFLSHIIPKAKLVPNRDIAEVGFRDLEKRKKAANNPVAYVGNPRLGTAVALLHTTDDIESRLHEVSLPLLILHGAADSVTDPSVSKALYQKAKSMDKILHLYDDAWHGILEGEPDETVREVMADIIAWLDDHSAGKTSLEKSKGVGQSDVHRKVAVRQLIDCRH